MALYQPFLDQAQPSRMKKTRIRGTWLAKNRQQELCIYDKAKEMRDKGRDVSGLPPHIFRCELRWTTADKIRRMAGARTPIAVPEYWEHITASYLKDVQKHLFKVAPDKLPAAEHTPLLSATALKTVCARTFSSLLRAYKAIHATRALDTLVWSAGAVHLTSQIGRDEIKQAISQQFGPSTVCRFMKKIDKAVVEVGKTYRPLPDHLSPATLYRELYDKLLAP